MVIRQVTPNITTLSVPFARFGRFNIGGRATLVRLQSGSVAVFSPVALTPDVKTHISSFGTVRYIIAPDFEHHIFLGPWHQEYPDAKVIGVEGLSEKRARQNNEAVPFGVVFTKADYGKTKVDEEFDGEFDYEYLPSHINKELVFLAKREKTLIEADLMFNLPATEQYSKAGGVGGGLLSKLFVRLQGTSPGAIKWQQRFIWYGSSGKDRPAFSSSVAKIARWDFDRIIPCHGDVVESGGNEVFKKLFAWHLEADSNAKAGKKD
jgi:hypothetical protein